MIDDVTPKTLLDAVRYYSDPKVCFETMIRVKWPDGKPICPKCGHDQVYIIPTRRLLQCKSKTCKKQFSVKVGTIFEDSPLGLDKWFVATWYIANCKNGISSLELGGRWASPKRRRGSCFIGFVKR
jgi:transposase-like protein